MTKDLKAKLSKLQYEVTQMQEQNDHLPENSIERIEKVIIAASVATISL